jgi:recombination protein RecA
MAKKPKAELDLSGNSIDAIAAKLNKKYGANTLITADKAEGLITRHISTGVHALDFALGGGFVKNRVTEIRGGFSSLKSTVCLCTVRNFLAESKDGLVLYVDAEHTFDPNYLDLLGIPKDRLLVVNPDSGEQAVDVLDEVLSIADKDTLSIVDSIAALVPTAELEASMEQMSMGAQARLVNKFLRKANSRIKRSMYDMDAPSATILCINQLREKIGVMFGNPETTPGGKGKDFFFSTILRLNSTPSCALKEKVVQNGEERMIRFGQTVNFSVLKNKVGGSQYEEGEFEYYIKPYKGHEPYTFNNIETLVRFGVFYGLIEFTGNTYRYLNVCSKKQSDFANKIEQQPKMCAALYGNVLEAIVESEQEFITSKEAEQKFDSAEAEEEVVAEEMAEEVETPKPAKPAKKRFSFK